MRTERYWSKEKIIFELQRWTEKYGEPPTIKVLNRVPDLPDAAVINYYFGTRRKAYEEAGLVSRGRGCAYHTIRPAVRNHGKIVPYREHHLYDSAEA